MEAGAPPSTDPERAPRSRLAADPDRLRDETDTERLDRNLIELLQEVRVVQTGVQVLFAFLLTVPFSSRFDQITDFQRGAYFAALAGTAAASVFLIAPTSVHRILFRMGQKEYMVELSNRLAIGGLLSPARRVGAGMMPLSDVMFGGAAAVAIAVVTAVSFGYVWAALPLRRRREVLASRRRR